MRKELRSARGATAVILAVPVSEHTDRTRKRCRWALPSWTGGTGVRRRGRRWRLGRLHAGRAARRGRHVPGAPPGGRAGRLDAGDPRRHLPRSLRAGPPGQLGASGRAADRKRRERPPWPRPRRIGSGQRRGLDARDLRGRLGAAGLDLGRHAGALRPVRGGRRSRRSARATAPTAPCRSPGPPAPLCHPAAERFLAAASTCGFPAEPDKNADGRPARGWCRATPSTAYGSTRRWPT